MRLRAHALALSSLLVLAACADETPLRPDESPALADAPSVSGDENYWNEDLTPSTVARDAAGRRMAGHDGPGEVGPTSRAYEITLENLTPDTGDGGSQVFSPPVIAAHRPSIHMYRVGRRASPELALIAEDAMNQPMVDRLTASRAVAGVTVGDGVIAPGSSASWQITTDAGRRALSMVFMLVNTNDGFGGVDALRLPAHGSMEIELYALDAGSEANDELESSIPGPCCGSVGTGTDTSEPIGPHPGILGVGDLDPAKWGWTGPVARLTVRRLEPAFEVTLRNLTPQTGEGSSQVFSPPVIATHSPSLAMFEVGKVAREELARIAEDAMNQPMLDLLGGSDRVLEVQLADGVIPPGGSATWEIQSGPRFRRVSMAFMLVNTNDGFSGVDRLLLPRSGSRTWELRALDAGSEANDELAASIPGPCCGSVGTGTPTEEPVHLHPGIEGIGDLDPAVYGWDEPAAELVVTRIR